MLMVELMRLAVGLAIAMFHRPLADFITEQDHALVLMFRRRGVSVPETMSKEASHTFFFSVGIVVAMIEMVRLYTMIH